VKRRTTQTDAVLDAARELDLCGHRPDRVMKILESLLLGRPMLIQWCMDCGCLLGVCGGAPFITYASGLETLGALVRAHLPPSLPVPDYGGAPPARRRRGRK
jgi:hypothetical protein